MSTHSFLARPTLTGYTGIYVHFDGQPGAKLPLLLAVYQYRFGRDLEAMTRHLVDDVAVGWDELGTDLLDGAPPQTIAALTGGEQWPSRTLDHLTTADGAPPSRMTVTEATAAGQGLEWGYVLRPQGIEVIPALFRTSGPVIAWGTDPLGDFSASAISRALTPSRGPGPVTSRPDGADTATRTSARR
ncbi:hypothetical protein [Streptomyces liliiviolaceus]|uniref:hypothetical protein n=1 Tax=Streptomyces liliiviolaceus TaxID=2823109 RepID=UPI001FFC75EB|nr:hypothetical protein [Streptomyces liliiviolaceus]